MSRLWIMEQQEVKSNFRTAKVNNCRTASVSNFRTGNWKIRSCTAENMRRCKAANMRSYINISSPSPFLFKSPLSSHLPEIFKIVSVKIDKIKCHKNTFYED